MGRKKQIRNVKIPKLPLNAGDGLGLVQFNIRISPVLKEKINSIADKVGWARETLVSEWLWDCVNNIDFKEDIKKELIAAVRDEVNKSTGTSDLENRVTSLAEMVQQTVDFITAESMGVEQATENQMLRIQRDLIYKIATSKKYPNDAFHRVALEQLVEDGLLLRSESGAFQLA